MRQHVIHDYLANRLWFQLEISLKITDNIKYKLWWQLDDQLRLILNNRLNSQLKKEFGYE